MTIDDITNIKLDESKKYKILIINKGSNNTGDPVEPSKEILEGKLISQYRFMFIFECMSRNKLKKCVCINKIDYILNNKLIRECK